MKNKKTTAPVKATTQAFVEVEEVVDDILLMKDSSASIVIEVGAVNFWLLSKEEQEGLIASYAGFLNSLSFPIQILILSKKIDISSYLGYVDNKIVEQTNEVFKAKLKSYKDFIRNLIKKNAVLERRYFFIIPFNQMELGTANLPGKTVGRDYIVSRAKTALYPKRDHLLRLAGKMGLRAVALKQQELTELFMNLYNPSQTGRKLGPVENYTNVIMTNQDA